MAVIMIYTKFNDPTVNFMMFEIYGVILDMLMVVLPGTIQKMTDWFNSVFLYCFLWVHIFFGQIGHYLWS